MCKFLFWGAGKNGRLALSVWKQYGYVPDFFVDNNAAIQHTCVEDIEIISPQETVVYKNDGIVVITSGYEPESIREQLIAMGYACERIYFATNIYMIYHALFALFYDQSLAIVEEQSENVLFDFSNGMVLGGVEAWNMETMGYMKQVGLVPHILTRADVDNRFFVDSDVKEISFEFMPDFSREKIEKDVETILELGSSTIICNFPDYIFVLAVAAKIKNPHGIRIVSVQHNDELNYYLTYMTGKRFLHKYLYISENMADKMLSLGFPKEKMMFLPWVITCRQILNHKYSEEKKIRIGYAGRIVKEQKRLDMIKEVVNRLKAKSIRFELSMAGTGSYLGNLKHELIDKNVHFYGEISRNQIPQFWMDQDVMISCSEWEGHSISQCEAMAAGAVPIVTDVSGVRDDVIDGENGFIVSGDVVEQMVDKIVYLADHKDALRKMGKKAYETIKNKYQKEIVLNLWRDVLGIEKNEILSIQD